MKKLATWILALSLLGITFVREETAQASQVAYCPVNVYAALTSVGDFRNANSGASWGSLGMWENACAYGLAGQLMLFYNLNPHNRVCWRINGNTWQCGDTGTGHTWFVSCPVNVPLSRPVSYKPAATSGTFPFPSWKQTAEAAVGLLNPVNSVMEMGIVNGVNRQIRIRCEYDGWDRVLWTEVF